MCSGRSKKQLDLLSVVGSVLVSSIQPHWVAWHKGLESHIKRFCYTFVQSLNEMNCDLGNNAALQNLHSGFVRNLVAVRRVTMKAVRVYVAAEGSGEQSVQQCRIHFSTSVRTCVSYDVWLTASVVESQSRRAQKDRLSQLWFVS